MSFTLKWVFLAPSHYRPVFNPYWSSIFVFHLIRKWRWNKVKIVLHTEDEANYCRWNVRQFTHLDGKKWKMSYTKMCFSVAIKKNVRLKNTLTLSPTSFWQTACTLKQMSTNGRFYVESTQAKLVIPFGVQFLNKLQRKWIFPFRANKEKWSPQFTYIIRWNKMHRICSTRLHHTHCVHPPYNKMK